MKIVIAAVPYSDNLGDGVIADNLVNFVSNETSYEVTKCDISYRNEVLSFQRKSKNFDLFIKLPSLLRKLIVLIFFSIKYFTKGKAYLIEKLKNQNLLLIGGGQLISDVDLNFPLKLYFLIKIAEKYDIPTKVISVGVANKWNKLSTLLMKRVLQSKVIVGISVRDKLSKENIEHFFGAENVEIIPDPALMCSIVKDYQTDKAFTSSVKKTLGVGVAEINALNHSSDKQNELADNDAILYLELINKVSELGYSPVFFTNGAIEDERYLHEIIKPILERNGLEFDVAPQPKSPKELVNTIKSFNAVIAYRLHANIIATSLAIPCLGVAWDKKVDSFFEYTGKQKYVFESLKKLNASLDGLGVYLNTPQVYNPDPVFKMYRAFII